MKQRITAIGRHPTTKLLIFLCSILLVVALWWDAGASLAKSEYGYLGIFLINFISSATIFIPVPGVASVFFGGSIYPPLIVTIVSAIGATCGELFSYLIGYGGEELLTGSARYMKWLAHVRRWFSVAGFLTIFSYAALPLPFFDIMGLFAGSVEYPIWKFALATFLGKTVKFGLVAFAGERFLHIFS